MNITTIHSFHDTVVPKEFNYSQANSGIALRSPNF